MAHRTTTSTELTRRWEWAALTAAALVCLAVSSLALVLHHAEAAPLAHPADETGSLRSSTGPNGPAGAVHRAVEPPSSSAQLGRLRRPPLTDSARLNIARALQSENPPSSFMRSVVSCSGYSKAFDNDSNDHQWTTPSNWSPDGLPGPGDDVCIPDGVNVQLNGGSHVISSLLHGSGGQLYLSGADLEVTGSITSEGDFYNANGVLTLDGPAEFNGTLGTGEGFIKGPGDIDVNGEIQWLRGTITGTGVINMQGTMTVLSGGGGPNSLLQRKLDNHGTINWQGSHEMHVNQGGEINNLAGASFNVITHVNSSGIFGDGSGRFTNQGSFSQHSASFRFFEVAVTNTATLDVLDGELLFYGGSLWTDGPIHAAGNVLSFNSFLQPGTFDFAAGGDITAREVHLNGGTATITGTYNVTDVTTICGVNATFVSPPTDLGADVTVCGTLNLAYGGTQALDHLTTFYGSLITGTIDLDIDGAFDWYGGHLSGFGTTNANGGINLVPGHISYLERELTNNGTATCDSGALYVQGGGHFINPATSLFHSRNNCVITGDAQGRFDNAGTFRNTSTAFSSINVIGFYNSGAVDIQAGPYQFCGHGDQSGPFNAAGQMIIFDSCSDGGWDFLPGANITADTIRFDNGTTTITSTYDVSGLTELDGGHVIINAPPASMGSTLLMNNISFATLELNFPATVTLGTVILNNGAITGQADQLITGSFNWQRGTLGGSGTTRATGGISFASNQLHTLERALSNSATADWTGSGTIQFVGPGRFTNEAGAAFHVQSDGLLTNGFAFPFVNAGTLNRSTGSGTTQFHVGELRNLGTVQVLNGTLDFGGGRLIQTNGQTVLDGGNITNLGSDGVQILGGSLVGYGTLGGSLLNGGHVFPGGVLTAGSLSVAGNYTQQSSGQLHVSLGGTTPATDYSQLIVTGPNSAHLEGALSVDLINGFIPAPGNSFQPVTYPSHTGSFSVFDGDPCVNGHNFSLAYHPTDVTLTAQAYQNADLGITKADTPDPVTAGTPLTYTLTLTNSGPDAADNVTVVDTLPSGVTLESAIASQGTCSGTSTITCDLGSVSASATAAITLVVTPGAGLAGSTITNSATVASTACDSNTANDYATADTQVDAAPAGTITVNTTADDDATNGNCTLREAILAANTNAPVDACAAGLPAPNQDLIDFDLGGGTPSIAIAAALGALPAITERATIDGATGGATRVELNGGLIAGYLNGLTVSSPYVTIRKLVVNRFTQIGIYITGSAPNATIEGCYVGLNAAGTAAGPGNGAVGVQVDSGADGAMIGGSTEDQRNVVGGQENHAGVFLLSNNNRVEGNYIGLNAAGTAAVANLDGLYVYGVNNLIGGSTSVPGAPPGNVISSHGVFTGHGSANADMGIDVVGANNVVQGNIVGLDAAGDVPMPNAHGILVRTGGNLIGGPTSDLRNVISGNSGEGVLVHAAGDDAPTRIEGNFIGTDIGGLSDRGNTFGINVSSGSNVLLGGSSSAPGTPPGNVIAGNVFDGAVIGSSSNITVTANLVGLGSDGVTAVGNGRFGLWAINSGPLQIGGETQDERNVISSNGASGVNVFTTSDVTVTIQGNFIGTDVAGVQASPNVANGVRLNASAGSTVIGGLTAAPGEAPGNVISANGLSGISVGDFAASIGTTILGNIIGLDESGTAALGNAATGVRLENGSFNNAIGGSDQHARRLNLG